MTRPTRQTRPPTGLYAAPLPCVTCPYRTDTPPGIWSADEYEKLPQYDTDVDTDGDLVLAAFHCHQENATGVATVCRGWLSVHPDSVAVRVALLDGRLTVDQRDAEVGVELYGSGQEACEAGLAGVAEPPHEARLAVDKLVRRRAGRFLGEGDTDD